MGKIKENQVGKDIAFEKLIQHADRLSNKQKEILVQPSNEKLL